MAKKNVSDRIIIHGARQHNLKNIHLELPKNKIIVVTGLSGSGKSSLVFDTIYAEGQRRYIESLSAYARQFLEVMDKPDVDFIDGLSPSIAIQQHAPGHNPRSTVGTVTEIYDYLRLLFARIGVPHCPVCKKKILPQSSQQIIESIMKTYDGKDIDILAPIVKGRTGIYTELFRRLRSSGYVKVMVDGKIYSLESSIQLSRYKKHNIDLIIDRINVCSENKTRIADSVEISLRESKGLVKILIENKKEVVYSEHFACPDCGLSFKEIEPRMFSFNSPYGACPCCGGLGTKLEIAAELVVPDEKLSISEGAIMPWTNPITTRTHRWKNAWSGYYSEILSDVCERYGIPSDVPFERLTEKQKNIIFYGDGDFEGVINNLDRRYRETESSYVKEEIYKNYIRKKICPECNGKRLKKEALSVFICGKNITEITEMSIKDVIKFFSEIDLTENEKIISKQILKEINSRLCFLSAVGLDYLSLDRETSTLAGGEMQRIHLATQIGSGLTGVLYVLDEPTIGLHQRDARRLFDTIIRLRDLGNTLIVVEHDEYIIRNADWIVDLGPGAGIYGGKVVVSGTVKDLFKNKSSITGKYLKGQLKIKIPQRRKVKDKYIEIYGARHFNLKNINIKIPLGLFVCVTGVSGSGKSTLVYEILYKALSKKLHLGSEEPGLHDYIKGIDNIDKVIVVDQSPIGRTPRSNPVTYTGVFSHIRDLFSQLPESKKRGYGPGRFSFNVKGGRCENCCGDGTIKIEMQFLPDVYVPCDVCHGKRFNDETLQVKFKGKNISDILETSVEEAIETFRDIPYIVKTLKLLYDVGLGYIKLGQPATTLSGGEAQRVKLAKELQRKSTGKTLYILDEPTTGLHFADVEKLLNILHRLVDMGNTVIVIEHNMEVIKTADWIIDLGPEGGNKGGEVVAEGPPEYVINVNRSYTGQYLKKYL